MINNVVLVGRLTRDLDLQYSAGSNVPVLSFSLAVGRNFKNKEGGTDADFINCVAWRQSAEYLSRYAHKGDMVAVSGRLQSRSYVPKNATSPDQRVYVTEVVCDNVQLVSSKQQSQNSYNPQNDMSGFSSSPAQNNGGFNSTPNYADNGGFNSTPSNLSDQGMSSDLANASTSVPNTDASGMSEDDLPFL